MSPERGRGHCARIPDPRTTAVYRAKTLTNAALREPQPSSQFHDHFRIADRSFQGAHEAAGAARKAQKCPARRSAAGHQHSEEEEFGAYEDAPHDWAHAAR